MSNKSKKSVGFQCDKELLKIWLKYCIDREVRSGPEIERLIKEELKRAKKTD